MACILLWSSAVKVHDSQAYRKMDVTRGLISRILELTEILLSFQTGFNLVNASVVVLSWNPRQCLTVSSFCPFTLIDVLMPPVLFVISLVFSALILVIVLPPMLTVPS